MTPQATSIASQAGGDPRLVGEIRTRIRSRGPIPFKDFMALALYHPEWGYYLRTGDPVGRDPERDYYTAPSRHPLFGTLLGRQVRECLDLVGGGELEIVEMGPGGGDLSASLWREVTNVRENGGLTYTLVEPSSHRREEQKRRMEKAGAGEFVRWMNPREWERAEETFRGCVIANEVLDALPVHRLVHERGEWQEIYVDWHEGFVEIRGPVSDPATLHELNRLGVAPREGQELELGLEAIRWVEKVTARLEKGYVILVDYGYLAPEMFDCRHQRGTLLAYYRHRAHEDYLGRVGHQDLTAHVNFSSIRAAAQRANFVSLGPIPQGRFLLALGILDSLAEGGEVFDWETHGERKAIQDLFLPRGMGESHQVLVLSTEDVSTELTGFRSPQDWDPPRAG